ncbi:4829_t:CDS:1 [Acaulospora morrowiae]|uniref:4829_t:CDS:1 n=1 Tax=Acaulospora morrowiae TaxID=94023 RepID=A0A9N9FDU7_9GLOM|nr:4829_t:CDS:1 [Acaulospora morrowiae]
MTKNAKNGNGYLIFRTIKLVERQDRNNPIKMVDHSDATSREWNELPQEEQLIYLQIHEILSGKYKVDFNDLRLLVFHYDPALKLNDKVLENDEDNFRLYPQYKKWYDLIKGKGSGSTTPEEPPPPPKNNFYESIEATNEDYFYAYSPAPEEIDYDHDRLLNSYCNSHEYLLNQCYYNFHEYMLNQYYYNFHGSQC